VSVTVQVELDGRVYDLVVRGDHAWSRYEERVLGEACTQLQAAIGIALLMVTADEVWDDADGRRCWAAQHWRAVGVVDEEEGVIYAVTVRPRETLFGFDGPWQRLLTGRARRKVQHGFW